MWSNMTQRKKDEKFLDWKIRLIVGKINKEINLSWEEIRNLLGLKCSPCHLRKTGYGIYEIYTHYKNKTTCKITDKSNNITTNKQNYPSKNIINSDGTQIDEKILKVSSLQNIKNSEFLLKEHGYDSSVFELVKATSSKWNVFSNSEGMQDLYSSRIVVKRKECPLDLNVLCTHFLESVDKYKPEIYTKQHNSKNKKLTLEIPIFDYHYGKLCWGIESGENYDHKIAKNLLWDVIRRTLEKVDLTNIKQILFPIGNDFFNTDTINNTTTKGTLQFNDVRWQKMYLNGFNLVVDVLNSLSTIAPVKVFYVPGNHDKQSSFFLLTYLTAWFKDCENVNIDNNIKTRYYCQFGNNLIGYTHKLDKTKIRTIMQSEVRELWGKSKFCEWHNGHMHSEQAIIEQGGLIIRNLSAIVAIDSWHYEEGYIGAIRKLQSFLWDDEEGLVSILYTIVNEL